MIDWGLEMWPRNTLSMILQNVCHSNDLRRKHSASHYLYPHPAELQSFFQTTPHPATLPACCSASTQATAWHSHISRFLCCFLPTALWFAVPLSIISGYFVYKIVASVPSFLWSSFFCLHSSIHPFIHSFREWPLWVSLAVSITMDHANDCHRDQYGWPSLQSLQLTASMTTTSDHHSKCYNQPPQWLHHWPLLTATVDTTTDPLNDHHSDYYNSPP